MFVFVVPSLSSFDVYQLSLFSMIPLEKNNLPNPSQLNRFDLCELTKLRSTLV